MAPMRLLLANVLALTAAAAATNVELLHGTVRPGAHSASGEAAVVLTSGKRLARANLRPS
jgi:hypothetical protein